MTTIRVSPEQLFTISKQFATACEAFKQMNQHLIQSMMNIEANWDGSTREKFYDDFRKSQLVMNEVVALTYSISATLLNHGERFLQADLHTMRESDPNCFPPPPNACSPLPVEDKRNAFQKSVDSLKELGEAFLQSADDRYQKRYDSVGGFLDYWTFGIPSGLVNGYVDRADKAFNSPQDTLNWLTFGVHGTIREATLPANAWSSEHWANMIGAGGMVLGVSSVFKPKIHLEAPVKYDGAVDFRQILSNGQRNELPLTDLQKVEVKQYLDKLDFPEENIAFAYPGYYDTWNTGMMFNRLVVNTDVLPAAAPGIGTLSANSRISMKATLAHEIIGHYEAANAGRAFPLYNLPPEVLKRNFALDEAQASIRAARFAPELSSTERYALLRDAIVRLHNADLRVKDVKSELFIDQR
ncbi:WXG100 family type VII secretion target [Paenibacillus hubeiensis]|uniref:WXG100 family type VII secretion target n=1 Tax=Paenibacillus hubeiensis TaxID=3077330 RepID=UPI0031BBC5A6